MTMMPAPVIIFARGGRLRHDLNRDKLRGRRRHRYQRQLALPRQAPPRIQKTRRYPISPRNLRRRRAGPQRLGHQRQLLFAGPPPPPFRLRQDLRHRVYGHLKRARKLLATWATRPRPNLYPSATIYKAVTARRLRMKWRSASSARQFRLLNQILTLDQVAEF